SNATCWAGSANGCWLRHNVGSGMVDGVPVTKEAGDRDGQFVRRGCVGGGGVVCGRGGLWTGSWCGSF
ncbi:MAG: hypothetical protein ACKOJF_15355, partial [Planctomycetaceae bacterium]